MQMALGQALFDAVLASQQPVHGGVQLILVDGTQRQQVAEGGDGAFGVQAAGGGEFGASVDDAGDDHGDDEVTLTGGGTSDEGMEGELAEEPEDGGDVAVGELRRQRKADSGLTRDSPLRALRTRSMTWSGRWEMLPRVSWRTLPSWRKVLRRRWVR